MKREPFLRSGSDKTTRRAQQVRLLQAEPAQPTPKLGPSKAEQPGKAQQPRKITDKPRLRRVKKSRSGDWGRQLWAGSRILYSLVQTERARQAQDSPI